MFCYDCMTKLFIIFKKKLNIYIGSVRFGSVSEPQKPKPNQSDSVRFGLTVSVRCFFGSVFFGLGSVWFSTHPHTTPPLHLSRISDSDSSPEFSTKP
ncbi:hypothetical protein DVH24_025518 [Malus domestica]|uniref:Uncharacterized protein n=1 Tax=Malus domestica TaxID=3750 RepID=A0A498HRE3_MALDO|nr:hypothetical protein DVH24_025518 [Malus domestica]